jgi:hypothetical protein
MLSRERPLRTPTTTWNERQSTTMGRTPQARTSRKQKKTRDPPETVGKRARIKNRE